MSFSINSSSLGFTYSQCNVEPVKLLNWLREEFSHYAVIHAVVSREQHQDGNYHLHAAIKLGRQFRSRDARFGDFNGFHPNCVRPRSYPKWVEYVKKHGSYEEYGSLEIKGSNRGASEQEVMANATSKSRVEFLIWAGVNKVQYAKDIWDGLNNNKHSMITITEDQIIGGTIDPKFQKLIMEVNWVQDKCLFLIGDSGIGKTTYAKQIIPKPCLFVTHIDDLKKFQIDFHKAILFDDVCFNHYPVQSQIHLVDFENPRSIHVRYGIAQIPAGVPKIFTCNEDPVNLEHAAIRRRSQVIRCDVKTLRNFQ